MPGVQYFSLRIWREKKQTKTRQQPTKVHRTGTSQTICTYINPGSDKPCQKQPSHRKTRIELDWRLMHSVGYTWPWHWPHISCILLPGAVGWGEGCISIAKYTEYFTVYDMHVLCHWLVEYQYQSKGTSFLGAKEYERDCSMRFQPLVFSSTTTYMGALIKIF